MQSNRERKSDDTPDYFSNSWTIKFSSDTISEDRRCDDVEEWRADKSHITRRKW